MRASFLHSLRRVHTDILHNGCTIMPFGNAWSHISFFTIIKWVVSSLQMGVKTKNQAQLALNDILVIARTVLLSSKCSNLIAFLMEDLDFIHKNDTRRCVHKDTILSQGLLLYRFFFACKCVVFYDDVCYSEGASIMKQTFDFSQVEICFLGEKESILAITVAFWIEYFIGINIPFYCNALWVIFLSFLSAPLINRFVRRASGK